MQAQEIYNILRAGGLSRAGALGMLGNMAAESSLIPNIAQRGMTNLSDETYTDRANKGTIDFVRDSVGYGLCQWTFWSRKQALLEYAREYGVSVGDGPMQVNFCLTELRDDYANLFKMLCESDNIDQCADKVCNTYERPAVNNYMTRRSFAHKFEAEIPETPTVSDKKQRAFALLDELREIINYMEG